MKSLTITTLAFSIFLGSALPVHAESTVGTVKAWQYMQTDGWKSADNFDDNTMINALYQADVIGNYPWTKQFILRQRGQGAYFLADKKMHTVRKLKLSPASGFNSDLTSVYQGENQGNGCYFTIIDTQYQLLDEALNKVLVDDREKYIAQAKEKFSPKVIWAQQEACINKKQQAAIAAKHSEEEKKLQQWVASQSLAELCRRTSNC